MHAGLSATSFFFNVSNDYLNIFQEDKIFYISKCQVKLANKKFCSLNNSYELSFTNETEVIPCSDDDNAIPKLQFNFTSLSSIVEAEPGLLMGKYA